MNPNKARADRFDAVVDAYGSDSPCENRIGYLISENPIPEGVDIQVILPMEDQGEPTSF